MGLNFIHIHSLMVIIISLPVRQGTAIVYWKDMTDKRASQKSNHSFALKVLNWVTDSCSARMLCPCSLDACQSFWKYDITKPDQRWLLPWKYANSAQLLISWVVRVRNLHITEWWGIMEICVLFWQVYEWHKKFKVRLQLASHCQCTWH